MSDLVKRLRDWEHVWPDDMNKPAGHLYEDAADRIEELEAKLSESEALLAKAVKLIELAIELGRWELNPSFRDELIDFTAELTSSEAANGEAKGGKDD